MYVMCPWDLRESKGGERLVILTSHVTRHELFEFHFVAGLMRIKAYSRCSNRLELHPGESWNIMEKFKLQCRYARGLVLYGI